MRLIANSALGAALLLIILGIPQVDAGWLADGIALTLAENDQWGPRITASDSSRAIITWYDRRAGGAESDIYVQKIDRFGDVEWTADGSPVCTAAFNQEDPVITADGAGGAVIVWEDNRTGLGPHVYAQKVDRTGAVQWTADGVRICSTGSNQYLPEVVGDDAGGAITVWQDVRGFGNELFAQRVDAAGAVQWSGEGIAICTAGGTQDQQILIRDGAGGAIVIWRDRRGVDFDIYAQKMNSGGAIQWTADGIPICTASGNQAYPQLISDGAGGAIVTWEDSRGANSDIYIQHIDSLGAPQWGADGIAICSENGNQYIPMITPDGTGGAFLVWRDFRGSNSDIYAQRIDAAGGGLWNAGGIVICEAPGNQYDPTMIADESGGAILLWQDDRYGNYDLFAQRVQADGTPVWIQNGIPICTAVGPQEQHCIATDGYDGAIIAWKDGRPQATSPDIFVNSINFAGKQKVPALLAGFTHEALPARITLRWELCEPAADIEYRIYRFENGSDLPLQLWTGAITADGPAFTFIDESCRPGAEYRYRVECYDSDGGRMLFQTGAITVPGVQVSLRQNYPNPFNPSTTISFSLPEAARVRLAIFDPAGKHVRLLLDERVDSGLSTAFWDGSDQTGKRVSSGVYFYRLTTGKTTLTRKMVLVK